MRVDRIYTVQVRHGRLTQAHQDGRSAGTRGSTICSMPQQEGRNHSQHAHACAALLQEHIWARTMFNHGLLHCFVFHNLSQPRLAGHYL